MKPYIHLKRPKSNFAGQRVHQDVGAASTLPCSLFYCQLRFTPSPDSFTEASDHRSPPQRALVLRYKLEVDLWWILQSDIIMRKKQMYPPTDQCKEIHCWKKHVSDFIRNWITIEIYVKVINNRYINLRQASFLVEQKPQEQIKLNIK